MAEEQKRESFSGKVGFILAAAGSAVGLGNIWRFPYLAEQYGGGIFLLTYILLVVTFGFALMLTEIALGRRTGKSCVDAFGDLSRKHSFIGWLAILVPVIVVPYYCVIGGWVTKYFAEFAIGSGDLAATDGFFNSFIGCGLSGIFDSPVTWFVIFAAISVLVVAFGVEKGIERMSKILMPVLLFLMIFISVYALMMPGALNGLEYYLMPDFSEFSMGTVLGAVGQLFYSMSLAMGIMITYGSYMKKDISIERSVRQISMLDTGVAFLAGLMIVPSVVALGMDTGEGGTGLMFVTLPKVFESMPAGDIIGAAFFFLVIIAAMTSAISLSEVIVSAIKDRLKWSRKKASALVIILIFALGTLSCLGYGPLSVTFLPGGSFLDFFDFITNSVIMPVVAILTCIFIGYVVKPKFIIEEIESSGEFKFKRPYVCLVKYVCPVLLAFILVTGLLDMLGIYSI